MSLNEHRQPTQFPQLPQWALPRTRRADKAHPASGPRPLAIQRGPIDQKTTARIEGFRRILGDAIYGEILWRAGHARRANDIPNAQFQANVAEAMERAARGVHKANSLAEQIGEASFIAVMDKLQIESMTTIPRLECLKALVTELEGEASRSVCLIRRISRLSETGVSMRNVTMIRLEPGLVSIPVESAVYCRTCETISTSVGRCGLCGSERIIELASLFTAPWDPGPTPAVALAA